MRDRLLVWCSHCEVQLQQIENNSLPEESSPADVVIQLKEELDTLENAREELRELGRSLVLQGAAGIESELEMYLATEDAVLLRLAQMQVRLAQKEQDRLDVPISPAIETVSMSDSGVFSYADRESMQGASEQLPVSDAASRPQPACHPKEGPALSEQKITEDPIASQPSIALSRPVHESTPPKSSQQQVPPPCPPRREVEETALGARQRTYADVAKSPSKSGSPVRSPPPPPVSIKSDTQRHLELALQEWRQRLARLDHMIKTSNLSEPSVDAANEIVKSILSINPQLFAPRCLRNPFLSGPNGCHLPVVPRFGSTSQRPPQCGSER